MKKAIISILSGVLAVSFMFVASGCGGHSESARSSSTQEIYMNGDIVDIGELYDMNLRYVVDSVESGKTVYLTYAGSRSANIKYIVLKLDSVKEDSSGKAACGILYIPLDDNAALYDDIYDIAASVEPYYALDYDAQPDANEYKGLYGTVQIFEDDIDSYVMTDTDGGLKYAVNVDVDTQESSAILSTNTLDMSFRHGLTYLDIGNITLYLNSGDEAIELGSLGERFSLICHGKRTE